MSKWTVYATVAAAGLMLLAVSIFGDFTRNHRSNSLHDMLLEDSIEYDMDCSDWQWYAEQLQQDGFSMTAAEVETFIQEYCGQ
jgi:Zn-dependent oligopeptidase